MEGPNGIHAQPSTTADIAPPPEFLELVQPALNHMATQLLRCESFQREWDDAVKAHLRGLQKDYDYNRELPGELNEACALELIMKIDALLFRSRIDYTTVTFEWKAGLQSKGRAVWGLCTPWRQDQNAKIAVDKTAVQNWHTCLGVMLHQLVHLYIRHQLTRFGLQRDQIPSLGRTGHGYFLQVLAYQVERLVNQLMRETLELGNLTINLRRWRSLAQEYEEDPSKRTPPDASLRTLFNNKDITKLKAYIKRRENAAVAQAIINENIDDWLL